MRRGGVRRAPTRTRRPGLELSTRPTPRLSHSELLRRGKYARWAVRHLSMDPALALYYVVRPSDDLLARIRAAEAEQKRMAA